MSGRGLFDDLLYPAADDAGLESGDSGDNGDNALAMRLSTSPADGDAWRQKSMRGDVVATCRKVVSSVDPATTGLFAVSPLSPASTDADQSATWYLIEGNRQMPITVWPPVTADEMQTRHPGVVVELRVEAKPDPAAADLGQAIALAALMGERDIALIRPFAADPEALAWLRLTAAEVLRREPDRTIAALTPVEVISAAIALADTPGLAPVITRQIAALRPAIEALYGTEGNRAGHACAVLRLLAGE